MLSLNSWIVLVRIFEIVNKSTLNSQFNIIPNLVIMVTHHSHQNGFHSNQYHAHVNNIIFGQNKKYVKDWA